MMRRRLWASLLGCVGITALLLIFNLAFRNTPVLGLDLQGGVSVVLAPEEGASGDDLIVIRDLIRDELENRGIAEPDVRVEGSNIIVDLPGVKDQRDALDAVDVAGIVTLRPVFACAGEATTGTSVPSSVPDSGPTTTGGASVGSRRPVDVGRGLDLDVTDDHGGTSRVRQPQCGTADHRAGHDRAADDDHVAGATTTTVPGATTTSTVATAQPETTVLRQLGGGSCLVGPAGAGGEDIFERNGARSSCPSSSAGPSSSTSARRARARGTPSPSSATPAPRRARAGSWRSCSTTSCSRRRSVNQASVHRLGPDQRQLHGRRGPFARPGAQPRRLPDRRRGAPRRHRLAHARRGLDACVDRRRARRHRPAADPADRSSTGGSPCSSPPG